MNAKMCDRCGELLEPYKERKRRKMAIEELAYDPWTSEILYAFPYDLCDECYDSFCVWLKIKKHKKNGAKHGM